MFPAPRRVRRKRTAPPGAPRDPDSPVTRIAEQPLATQTHRWPLDGEPVPLGQRCDLADPAAVAILPGPIR
jgi:hypothetical protein